MNDEIIRHFETTWKDYDAWYDRHPALYRTELAALQRVVPSGMGLEIGVGTGRFAAPLGVGFGLDPAIRMLRLAKARGLLVARGRGERLPFKNGSFDFVQLVFVLEFVENLAAFLGEAARTVRPGGALILGFIDRDSAWGRYYAGDPSHRRHFHPPSSGELLDVLARIGLAFQDAYQVLFQPPPDLLQEEVPRPGYGEGGFIALKAVKR